MLKVVEVSIPTTNFHLKSFLNPNPSPSLPILTRNTSKTPTKLTSKYPFKTSSVFPSWKISPAFASVSGENLVTKSGVLDVDKKERSSSKKRVFFLDVNPLCYDGSKPSLHSFAHWISLFFSQVSLADPVIAVFDGDGANDRRRQLLPSYKAHRRKLFKLSSMYKFRKDHVERSQVVKDILSKCNVPIVKAEGHEADDVVATLVGQSLERGYRVVVASPDKDFKQLISDDVQIVSPIRELDRWSFYTLKHYIAQYSCDPSSDLSLRCMIGDEVDGVPGLQDVAPGFGRKTALKLLRKHGSLEHLLDAAAVRSVGRQHVQEALTKHGDYLRRNYEVLALKRDVDVHLQEEWLVERDTRKDSIILSNFFRASKESRNFKHHNGSHSSSSQYSDNSSCKKPQKVEDNGHLNRLTASAFGFSFGQITLFSSAQVAHASDSIKTNALYDTGELFELGIQLSYLLLLLALLGVGTFFVIRQVLVRRELDLSAKELQEQVRSGDASATEYFELGAVMLRRKFYPAANKYLLQAIDKWDGDDQDLAQVYNALGVSYVRDGKLDKGIEQFETAVKLQPGYVTAWNNLGDAYEQKKDLKSALKAFEEVLLFDPNNLVARPRRDALKDRVQMYKGVPVKSKDR